MSCSGFKERCLRCDDGSTCGAHLRPLSCHSRLPEETLSAYTNCVHQCGGLEMNHRPPLWPTPASRHLPCQGCLAAFLLACLFRIQTTCCVSQGRICSDKYAFCHTATKVKDQSFYLTHSQHADTELTSPNGDPIMSLEYQCLSHWYDRTRKKIHSE